MNISLRSTLAVLGLILVSSPVFAGTVGDKDPASDIALRKTQEMLTQPGLRQQALQADPRAKAMDSAAKAAVGDDNMADVYSLASDLMGTLAEESGGDPVRMMELLQEAQKNPELLEKKFTPEQRAKIKAISQRLPAAAPNAAPATGLK